MQLTLAVFIQVAGVVPVSLVSDLSRIFLFKLTFKKGGKSHRNKPCFNSDKALALNKARKVSLEPATDGWAFPSRIHTDSAAFNFLPCLFVPCMPQQPAGHSAALPGCGDGSAPGEAPGCGSAQTAAGSWRHSHHQFITEIQMKKSLKSSLEGIWVLAGGGALCLF